MAFHKRPQLEPPDDWLQLQLQLVWPEQITHIVLFAAVRQAWGTRGAGQRQRRRLPGRRSEVNLPRTQDQKTRDALGTRAERLANGATVAGVRADGRLPRRFSSRCFRKQRRLLDDLGLPWSTDRMYSPGEPRQRPSRCGDQPRRKMLQ